MKLSFIKKRVLTLVLSFLSSGLFAQLVKHERLISFEEKEIPKFVSGYKSNLSISSEHFKDGKNSLSWSFQPKGELIIKKDLKFENKDSTGVDTYLSTFIVWVYNEKPMDKHLRFQFVKDGRICTSFPFGLNFKGWRTAWVCYERDMEGSPEEGMNELRIIAPDESGKLYIDHILTAAKMDQRHQTADLQVPFVNENTTNHWLVILNRSMLKPDLPLENTVSQQQEKDIHKIEERFRSLIYTPGKLTEQIMQNIRREYNNYGITYHDGKVSGLPIFYHYAGEAYERLIPDWTKHLMEDHGMGLKSYFDLMNKVAIAYNNAEKEDDKAELEKIFLSMYDHVTDQGIAYGSCVGNFTHYGYSFRGFYTSYFLMKDVLRRVGKLNEAEQTMRWYAMTNEVYLKPTAWGMDMDTFNTGTTGRIASILMMEDSPEKVQYLKSFSRWINNGCLPSEGLAGAFKKDGAAFHHRNNYPAYAVGGLDGATNMIYLLNHTDFAISELGHQTVKNALLAMRFYCNKLYFPLSMSGRHPNGKGKLAPVQFAVMAIAGSPDGSQEVDGEMAAAYLRLVSETGNQTKSDPEYMPANSPRKAKELKKLLISKGYKAETDPQGNIALGYGAVSVQRRNNWSAVARGHSRYLWAAEHYLGHNLYGRYLAHGSLQIMTAAPGEEVTPASGGWQEDGFDWGRIPGTTSIHLPVEQLKANVLNVDTCSGYEEMLYSDEAFAGGVSQEHHNGAFAMKLHEHDKYNGTHRARKSYHFFDGKIICLGSDIENKNHEYDTETTIFQLVVPDKISKDYWQNVSLENKYWLDHLGTGYFVPGLRERSRLKFERNFPQYSRKQDSGKETKGDWVSLIIGHGKAPKGEGYEYVIIPQTDNETMRTFVEKPNYKVLQRSNEAHIVKDLQSNTTSYVFFETPGKLPKGLVQQVDTTSMVMLREGKDKTVLTVCNPDLALYRGSSDEKFDKDGKRVERSIYSRPWIDNPSQLIPVRVTLKGKWGIKGSSSCKIVYSDKKNTILEFDCIDGKSIEVQLIKQ